MEFVRLELRINRLKELTESNFAVSINESG